MFKNSFKLILFYIFKIAECYSDFGSVYYVYEKAHFDINAPACAISIDGGISIGTYAIGIQISDYIKGSSVPLSTIPVKFIIKVVSASSCNRRSLLQL